MTCPSLLLSNPLINNLNIFILIDFQAVIEIHDLTHYFVSARAGHAVIVWHPGIDLRWRGMRSSWRPTVKTDLTELAGTLLLLQDALQALLAASSLLGSHARTEPRMRHRLLQILLQLLLARICQLDI